MHIYSRASSWDAAGHPPGIRQYQTEIHVRVAETRRDRRTTPGNKQTKKNQTNMKKASKPSLSCLLSFINTADCSASWHRGPSVRRMEPLTASVHLWELGSDRWIGWASDWVGGIARLLVEADPARPSTEFVHFNHMSEGGVVMQIGDC